MDKPKPLDLEELKLYKRIKVDFGSGKEKIIYDEKEAKKELKQRIKQACEFWFKYKNKPALFVKENKEYRSIVDNIWYKWVNKRPTIHSAKEDFIEEYNEWLLKLAFKSVLEEGE